MQRWFISACNCTPLAESVSIEKPHIHTRLISETKPLANKEESIYEGELNIGLVPIIHFGQYRNLVSVSVRPSWGDTCLTNGKLIFVCNDKK